MSDKFFLGNFFYDDCQVALTVLVVYMIVSLFPAMFQVSSLLLFNFDSMFKLNEWWRPVSGLFVCNHPDVLLLVFVMLYLSRGLEFHLGHTAYSITFIITIIFAAGPLIVLGLPFTKDFFNNRFLQHYVLAVPTAMFVANLVATRHFNIWKGITFINQKLGPIIVLFLALTNRYDPFCAIVVIWGCIVGSILGFLVQSCFKSKQAVIGNEN